MRRSIADLFLKFDATPPATTLGAGAGEIEGFLKFRPESLDRQSLLTMSSAPFLYGSNTCDKGNL